MTYNVSSGTLNPTIPYCMLLEAADMAQNRPQWRMLLAYDTAIFLELHARNDDLFTFIHLLPNLRTQILKPNEPVLMQIGKVVHGVRRLKLKVGLGQNRSQKSLSIRYLNKYPNKYPAFFNQTNGRRILRYAHYITTPGMQNVNG